ncbi:hypothetical protein BRARA_G00375 [Brassica rapa]|uniref:UNC-50 family protein n=1 Tax=Brassica campestris TaxID=3711 RepID=A0A397YHJ4_BRACM|nr:hypothetical protein BRARA_G00375 [Brassica rapa]
MLPTTSRSRSSSSSSSSRANPMFLQYFRRIVKWQQMDIEYTFWQMLNLCTSPKVVYQHTKYHKQTKNQWALLPFLERTTFFLYPIGIVIVLSPILILSGFNPSNYFMNMYFSQRL